MPGTVGAQKVTKETVPGVTNFARVETTVACAGATKAEAVPEIKKMGFASIINLRLPTEPGADVDAEAAAAKAAGIRFFAIPFNAQSPDPAVADRFLEDHHREGQRAGVHSLRGRKPRGRDVDAQAVGRRSLDRRPRRRRSDGAWSH